MHTICRSDLIPTCPPSNRRRQLSQFPRRFNHIPVTILQRRLGAKPRLTGAAELVVAAVTNYRNRGDVARGTLHGVR